MTQFQNPRAKLTSPDSVSGLLGQLSQIGYATSLRPGRPVGSLVCTNCASVSKMSQFEDVWARRFEGQSDPDDMVLVVTARCPVCGEGGSVVLGFGPTSSPEDPAIVGEVPDDALHRHRPD